MHIADGNPGALRRLAGAVESLLARGAVTLILLATLALAALGRALRRTRTPPPGTPPTLLLTGTFYNPGWFRSHILPLSACQALGRIVVVCDEPLEPCARVTYACPPSWLRHIVGRSAARLLWLWRAARSLRPAAIMGYHIMPNALMALVVAALTGTRAIYQMTGGPVQIAGGGAGSENALLRRQRKASRLRERLMFAAVRRFDCVVVRGRQAVEFLRTRQLARDVVIIPGSVDCERFGRPGPPGRFDLVGVGRLVPVKRWDRLLRIVAQTRAVAGTPQPGGPVGNGLTLAIAGDGPLAGTLAALARELDIEPNVSLLGRREDVPEVLASGRVFALASENEGLSIAMIEAMAAGRPVVAPNVGDLAELLSDGENGLFIDPERPADAARQLVELLRDPERLARMSAAARERAVRDYSVESVATKWTSLFRRLASEADPAP